MNSLHFHINSIFEAIRAKDYGGVIRNSEVILDLMDSVELRPTLDRVEKCLAQLESLGYSASKAAVSEKDEVLAEIEGLLQTLNNSLSMSLV